MTDRLASPPLVDGVRSLSGSYEGFVLDQWGVLHDGHALFPSALDALRRLRAAGKRIAILSNTSRRSAAAAVLLGRLGVGPELYDVLVTAGEATHRALRDRPDARHRSLGRACLLVGYWHEESLLAGLDLTLVEDPARASFVLLTSLPSDAPTVASLLPQLAQWRSHDLPLVCANPDRVVLDGERRIECPGAAALAYEGMGGRVIYHGKPDPGVYDDCLAALGVPRGRVLAVGDGLATDIAGAAAAGLDSALVLEGIHADEVGAANPAAIRSLLAREGVTPQLMLRRFSW